MGSDSPCIKAVFFLHHPHSSCEGIVLLYIDPMDLLLVRLPLLIIQGDAGTFRRSLIHSRRETFRRLGVVIYWVLR
jgi:hypothetical protein